ncbi:hypothetical protein A3F08_01715 [Candidatus Berkelbacteria bacterium RIFCSPHIGHO2_12_FULL_36_9]|uniref:Helix-turn-helix type 11 domain-containing protein n=1 Tax=Candidatus Berkelbacteria bacterium RIFCSPHIGHO2_12_FULL_36_9 TaxID=1797469 RepID=A0A1F5EDD1_9BACT|nr:MAG: hypothetical protein A3F08_01715 [Candidatus Berkelbacteria bacterium RIFCSPHIGHO2_12_FULL_36_9]
MLKKEIIWREVLFQALEKKNNLFTQKALADKFGYSLSTIFNALKAPREIKSIKVSGRNFKIINPQKFLYLWATLRRLDRDIIYQTHINEAVLQIEKQLPQQVVFAAYTACKKYISFVPADYDKVYVYIQSAEIAEIQKRFPLKKGYSNLIILRSDPLLDKYGQITTLAQTFVDLWNLEDWYADEFQKSLMEKVNAILA